MCNRGAASLLNMGHPLAMYKRRGRRREGGSEKTFAKSTDALKYHINGACMPKHQKKNINMKIMLLIN